MDAIPPPSLACTAETNIRIGCLEAWDAAGRPMSEAEYEVVLTALAEATRAFARHQGAFSSADLRARSLVSFAEKEVARSLVETTSRNHRRLAAVAWEKQKTEALVAS
jgi:hypothetical protein